MVAATVSRPQSAGAQYLDSKDALCTLQLPWPAHEPAQTYKDILDALQGLDVALDLVVGRVTKRVADEGQKLAALTGRIDAAAKRVSAVAGNRQAIVLFSAARFPGGKDAAKVKYFDRLFYDEGHLQRRAAEQLEIPEEPFVESLEEMAERRKKLDLSLRVDMDTIELYKADLELKPELATNNPSMPPPPDVLAPLPPSVSSVSSVLLFNTPYNVYADHTPFDNLSGEAAPRKDVRAKEEELAQAPQTVLFGDQLPEVERIEYSYKPVLGAVPELDVPSMLPNFGRSSLLDEIAKGKALKKVANPDDADASPKPKVPSDPRGSLLDEISKGAKLKKVDPDAPKKPPPEKPKAADEPMDMMAQLRDKINRRRAGISGGRAAEADMVKTADLPPTPSMQKAATMPNLTKKDDGDKDGDLGPSPISMGGIANALRAKAANMADSGSDDDDWESD